MAILLTFMVILVFGNVIMRYIFDSGIIWSEEMSRYLFVWLVFLGATISFKENRHLGVDIITNLLPKHFKKILNVLCYVIIVFLLVLLFIGSWKMTVLNLHNHAPVTGLPMFFVYGSGIVMSLLMTLFLFKNFIDEIKKRKN